MKYRQIPFARPLVVAALAVVSLLACVRLFLSPSGLMGEGPARVEGGKSASSNSVALGGHRGAASVPGAAGAVSAPQGQLAAGRSILDMLSAAGRVNNWLLFKAALGSENPAVIFRGIYAARECDGQHGLDLSTVESDLSAKPMAPEVQALRVAASRAYVAKCSGFAGQRDVADQMMALEKKLLAVDPDLNVAKVLADRLTNKYVFTGYRAVTKGRP